MASLKIDLLPEPGSNKSKNIDAIQAQLRCLNRLCNPASGFTFLAKSICDGHYEVLTYLYKLDQYPYGFICPARITFIDMTKLLLWIPQNKYESVLEQVMTSLNKLDSLSICKGNMMRFRLVGPNCIKEACRICPSSGGLLGVIKESQLRLSQAYSASIGRRVTVSENQTSISFIYFNSAPKMIDIILPIKTKSKMVWYELIKNRAHLMGGMRDLELFSINHPEVSRHPWFCQLDSQPVSSSDQKVLADMLSLKDPSKAFVVGDEVFLDQLAHLGHHRGIEKLLSRYKDIIDINNALLNVEIRLQGGKGNVSKYDKLFIAAKDYLLKYRNNADDTDSDNNITRDTTIAATQDNGSLCGFIENGAYSMFSGCIRAYGVLRLSKLVELISAQPRLPLRFDKFDIRILVELRKSGNVLRIARLVPMQQ